MALSAADTARLTALRAAYDKLISGDKVAKVTSSAGRSVDYHQADLERLKGEIDSLVAQDSSSGRKRGSVTFRFL